MNKPMPKYWLLIFVIGCLIGFCIGVYFGEKNRPQPAGEWIIEKPSSAPDAKE